MPAMYQAREYKTDADKVKVYDHRISQAQKAFEKWRPMAEKWVSRYQNHAELAQYTPRGHRVSVPVGTSVIDSLFSSLTATDVDVMVEADGAGTADQEYLATAALSKEWDRCKVNERASGSIKDTLLVGLGWVKVSFDYYASEQEIPRADEDIIAELDSILAKAEEDGTTVDVDLVAQNIEVTVAGTVVTRSRIVVDYVAWDQMLFDPTAKRVEDIRWFVQVSKLQPEEVRENPVWREYCKKAGTLRKLEALKGDCHLDETILGEGVKAIDEDMRVTVYEIHDLETGTVCTKAHQADFLLNEAPEPFAINDDMEDRSPFVPCILRRTPGRVRGTSDMELMLPTLQQLDLYHSRLATFVERYAPKVMAEEGTFTAGGKRALGSPEYGAVVELSKTRSANQVPIPFTPPVMPSEVYGVPEKLEQALYDATGVNELKRGLFPDRRRTATETAEVVNASAARQAEKRVGLERFYGAIARRMLQLMQMFYTGEQMVRYMDYEGPVEWKWTADDIVFETKLEVLLTPKEVRDRQALRDEALAILNVYGPLMQPDPATGVRMVDPTTLIRIVSEKMGLRRRDIAMLIPTAFQQQMQALAAQQAAAGMASAAAGLPRPDMVPGPGSEQELAAAVNGGTIPPEVLAAATGTVPANAGAVERVSESAGVITT